METETDINGIVYAIKTAPAGTEVIYYRGSNLARIRYFNRDELGLLASTLYDLYAKGYCQLVQRIVEQVGESRIYEYVAVVNSPGVRME